LFRKADFVLVAVVLALAVLALLFGQWLIAEPPIALSRDISPLNPQLFPSIVLLGIVAVAAVFIVNRLRGIDDVWEDAMASAEPANPRGFRRLLAFLILLIVCALLLERLGFLATMFVLMVATSLLVGNDNLPQIMLVSVAMPLAIYILVTHFLRTSLPELDWVEASLAPVLALLPSF
jgi:Tripartite tricarboxylate transporter TctB family